MLEDKEVISGGLTWLIYDSLEAGLLLVSLSHRLVTRLSVRRLLME